MIPVRIVGDPDITESETILLVHLSQISIVRSLSFNSSNGQVQRASASEDVDSG